MSSYGLQSHVGQTRSGLDTVTSSQDRALRVLVSHDDHVFPDGVARVLDQAGLSVVAQVSDHAELLGEALRHRPDVLLVDIRRRASGYESLAAAVEVRRLAPQTAVLVLSHRYEPALAPRLIGDRPEGVGYLLQPRISGLRHVVEAVEQVAAGASVLDPEVVVRLLGRQVRHDPLSGLTSTQLDVLAAMSRGLSNRGIAASMQVSEASVEKQVTAVFRLLRLTPAPDEHRRVRAVLIYLGATG